MGNGLKVELELELELDAGDFGSLDGGGGAGGAVGKIRGVLTCVAYVLEECCMSLGRAERDMTV